MTARPTWDEFFLIIAEAVSLRGDCSRRQVGAVIVDNEHRIVSAGYNGTLPGNAGCLEGACPRAVSGVPLGSSYDSGPGACIAIHAEFNAILYAGRSKTVGSSIYVTEEPCVGCQRAIDAAGIERVVTPKEHLNADTAHLLLLVREALHDVLRNQGEGK